MSDMQTYRHPVDAKRKEAGRPPRFGEPMTITRAYMTQAQIEYVKQVGGGEFSAGLRRIIDEHMTVMPRPAGAGHVCERCEVNHAPMNIGGRWLCLTCTSAILSGQPATSPLRHQ